MKIKFMKEESLIRLKQDVPLNSNEYLEKKCFLNESDLVIFNKEFPDFKLKTNNKDPEKTDFENIKILYSSLKELTESQAMEERVWAGLSHGQLWGYTQYRWGCETEKEIRRRYFFDDGAADV